MPTFRHTLWPSLRVVALATMLGALASTAHSAQFSSPQAAYEQGIGAWRAGYVGHAIPALKYAADRKVFLARFYLARIYSDNGTGYTDHAAAYDLYRSIANDFANIDPDDDPRTPFVAKAFTALARYVKAGMPSIGLTPNPRRAADYLRHAAQFFDYEDAQFELARLYLEGEGVALDPKKGLHWLSVLAQRGHAGAQAVLADLYWRGRQWRYKSNRVYHFRKDELVALSLIQLAVSNAPDKDRIWIEDIYQNIYCGSSDRMRDLARGKVASWSHKYRRSPPRRADTGFGTVPRVCGNGEEVVPVKPLVDRERKGRQPIIQENMIGVGVTDDQPAPSGR